MTHVTARDRWAEWILERRFADGDRRPTLEYLAGVRDKVLEKAEPVEKAVVLDVGCGDGLIGFGAIDRGAEEVVFSDISHDLLDTCKQGARDLGVTDRCRFVRASADDLTPIADESVDVVTTRSVLIYVHDKARAFREFHRVLRPQGRVSLFEPINRWNSPWPPGWLWGYDLSAVAHLAERVRMAYQAYLPPDTDPMLDFDERDLVDMAEAAGLAPVRLELLVDAGSPRPRALESFLRTVPNPKVPSFGEVIADVLAPDEREELCRHLRPLVEQGRGSIRSATAYLSATKP